MLSFLLANPWFVCGVVLTFSPVIIHWLSRRRAESLLFPTLRFLRAVSERTARRRHLEEVLLMLLRMLIMAVLAMLMLPGGWLRNKFLGNSQVTAVVIFDDSLSAGRERLAPILQAALANVLGSFPKGSAWKLVNNCDNSVAAPYTRLRPQNAKVVYEAGRSPHSTGMAGNLCRRVEEAVQALRAAQGRLPEIHIITDGQRREWLQKVTATGLRGLKTYVFAPPPEKESNFALTRVQLQTPVPSKGQKAELASQIRNFSARVIRGSLATHYGKEQVAPLPLELAPSGNGNSKSVLTLQEGAFADGYAQITGDDFPGDNRRYFTLPLRSSGAVLLLTPQESLVETPPEKCLRAALSSCPGGGEALFRCETADLENPPAGDWRDFSAVFVLEARNFSAEIGERLRKYVAAGGVAVFMPGFGSDAAAWNAALGGRPGADDGLLPAELAPWREIAEDVARRLVPTPSEELLSNLAEREIDKLFQRPYLHRHFPLRLTSAGRTVLALPDKTPFIAWRRYGKGRSIIWGAPLRADWCGIFTRPVFIPLVHAQIQGITRREPDYECGSLLPLAAPLNPAAVSGTMYLPTGGEIPLNFADASVANPAQFAQTAHPGIYRAVLNAPEKIEKHFAVNPATAESDLTPLGEAELRERLTPWGGKVFFADNLGDWERLRQEARQEYDLTSVLIMLLLGLFAAESFYADYREKRAIP